MKFQNVILSFFFLLLLAGCTDDERNIESKPEQVFASEEEKLLNEVLLSVIDTKLHYNLSKQEMEMFDEIADKVGYEKAMAYYEKKRKKDPTKLVFFTRDEFWGMYSSLKSKSLRPDMLELIKHILIENKFDSTTHILETLSQPLELSSLKLNHTGRYQVFTEQDKDNVIGEYKMYGSFNTSKIYIDKAKERAVLIYERNCMEGFKCAEGNLVILENGKDGWQVSKQFNLYVS